MQEPEESPTERPRSVVERSRSADRGLRSLSQQQLGRWRRRRARAFRLWCRNGWSLPWRALPSPS